MLTQRSGDHVFPVQDGADGLTVIAYHRTFGSKCVPGSQGQIFDDNKVSDFIFEIGSMTAASVKFVLVQLIFQSQIVGLIDVCWRQSPAIELPLTVHHSQGLFQSQSPSCAQGPSVESTNTTDDTFKISYVSLGPIGFPLSGMKSHNFQVGKLGLQLLHVAFAQSTFCSSEWKEKN